MKEENRGIKWFNTIFYPQNKKARAVRYEDGVLPRFYEREITLFTPWGPRYGWKSRGLDIKKEDKEVEVINFLATLFKELRENMPDKNFRWIFLGADLYGTRINNLPEEVVAGYFVSLAKWLAQILPEAELRLWSEFDKIADVYRQKIWTDFENFVDTNLLIRTEKTAQAMANGSNPKEYLVERLAEAMLVEEIFHPIKISCVARHKDDKVDWELPRLYFLPEYLHAPWCCSVNSMVL